MTNLRAPPAAVPEGEPADEPEAGRDRPSPDAMFPLLYAELRALAAARLRDERTDISFAPTDLVHEAWLRMARVMNLTLADRRHFFALCAKAMQRVLIDHARARDARKRQHGRRVELPTDMPGASFDPIDALDLAALLERLAKNSELQADIVALHIYCGMTLEEIAAELGLSHDTVRREWRMARARLNLWLKGRGDEHA